MRFLLAVLTACAFGMSATAADIHPPTADDMVCDTEAQSGLHLNEVDLCEDLGDDHDPDRDHDHHAHHCGSCHLHPFSLRAVAPATELGLSQPHMLGTDQTVPRAGPFGLFRPPRA
jgi:hypothetical protein